jgi:protein-S-isoprenylcysteine O-methyltransferase Ste14
MKLLPDLRFDLANQWILLIVYFVVFLIFVFRLSKERREWLFADPKEMMFGWRKFALRFGQLLSFALIILVCLTPLPKVAQGFEVVGLVLYLAGTILVPLSLHYFGKAPEDQPMLEGPYRYSRNPQWVGLLLVLLGLAVSTGAILLILLVVLVALIYHIQIVGEERFCVDKFGATYEEYMKKVPRYLFLI